MKKCAPLLVFAASALVLLAGCQRISLSKNPPGAKGSGSLLSDDASNEAPLDGDWTVTYVDHDATHDSTVTFSHQGKHLAGAGTDAETKAPFHVEGTIDGKVLHFEKKYSDGAGGVQYDGELSYENDADYKGWIMSGHYRATVQGKPLEDKWVAVNAAEQAAYQQSQPPAPQQPQQDAQQPVEQAADQQSEQPLTPPTSIAGTWRVRYKYNFKSQDTRLFLKQSENKLTGDGVDTNRGGEDTWFKVSKGWYSPPRVTMVCHYEKGEHSPVTRDVIVKGQIKPDGHIRAETQYGAEWNAYPVR